MPAKQKENIEVPRSTPADRERKRQLVGALIREKREALAITIDDFAYQIRISRSNLIRVENGSNSSIETLFIILCGLGITEAAFFAIIQERLSDTQQSEGKKNRS